MGKSINLWTFIIGGIVGGAIAYMGRGELERLLGKFGGGTTASLAQGRTVGAYYAPGVLRR